MHAKANHGPCADSDNANCWCARGAAPGSSRRKQGSGTGNIHRVSVCCIVAALSCNRELKAMTVAPLFDAVFRSGRGSQVALIFGQHKITYDQLRAETVRLAQALQAMGAKPEDRVALLLHDSPEFIASFIGIVSLGAIAVPINMGLSTHDQRFILNDSAAPTAIVEFGISNTALTIA